MNVDCITFTKAVETSLEASGLPVSDLREGQPVTLFSIRKKEQLAGAAGIEWFGATALLRSLAVAEGFRNHGYGRLLVGHIENWVCQHSVELL
jgi:GNAT superfamily N-acetyltransferase